MSYFEPEEIKVLYSKYLKYLKYKKKYFKLKNICNNKIKNFSEIVENAYNYAIENFGDMYVIIDNDPYKIFRLHQFGEDKRYKFNRYSKSDELS